MCQHLTHDTGRGRRGGEMIRRKSKRNEESRNARKNGGREGGKMASRTKNES